VVDEEFHAQPRVDPEQLDGVAAGGCPHEPGLPEIRKQTAAAHEDVPVLRRHYDDVVDAVPSFHDEAIQRRTRLDLNAFVPIRRW